MEKKKLPIPPPDRRTHPKKKVISSSMAELMLRQIDQLRKTIADFFIIPSRINLRLNYSELPNSVNILLFGPSGSGKSSLVRTLYRALHNTVQLPAEIRHKLVVKGSARNEGTTVYTTVLLKEETQYPKPTSGIKIHDTRGQIWMDNHEQAQADLILDGKVKDMARVEQRSTRYAYKLWEFWKSESQLFPTEILKEHPTLSDKPHCLLFVFDGSLEEIPNGEEETLFYREIMQLARSKGYFYPQIVLTHIDRVEDKSKAEEELREILDMKIEGVVMKLGIPRSSVHFIENYHDDQNEPDLNVDFHVLRLLHESAQQGESYLQSQLKEKSACEIQ